MFENRMAAGQKLAIALQETNRPADIVIAIPRGGVVVGHQVARALGIPLDIIIPKKVGAPQNPEVAVGAVTQDGTAIYHQELLSRLGLSEKQLQPAVQKIIDEINRRTAAYRNNRPGANLAGRHVIVVDDGIATGFTILAALQSIKNSGCQSVTLAVPVAPPETVQRLAKEVDHLVCLVSREPFYAVGQFYLDFSQVKDDEVIAVLQQYNCDNQKTRS
ncbi:phosphoribosyltransferase [Desulforamulus hydrothermalis]|uniref:Phosphoribosyltransferase n=1 Tax=Desulforamulus hydrothermalis Lam5 = DSM 18033 TaxID=1121428 RepID=K8E9S0_9FIRM|nr:phosphoribosyltransferase [Desulforamulus hydrothermalis]CCO08333.1 Phosphoribosyltransferase [Desulforamulus hydrothermalis Lam5 = DSM 18033]SHH45007.1 Predicted phosphoribosyltransferase [Desulforamulus hydrothermalis Lam5 = DSM 18033]